MTDKRHFYIDGRWVPPSEPRDHPVIDPATEDAVAMISLGGPADTDAAVAAARAAFPAWSTTPLDSRIAALERLRAIYKARAGEMAHAISSEMGAPITLARTAQCGAGGAHLKAFIAALREFAFETPLAAQAPDDRLIREPIGVCGLITPWNWPMNQVMLKVIPALGVGCTVVLKPSEVAPLSSLLLAEMIHEAGFPPGVFNLVNGDGAGVGTRLSGHPDVDMISFTGSTRAGIAISKDAADTVKRVGLELGGKGANLIFADADDDAVSRGVRRCFNNSGQSCNAPTRMLVERSRYASAVEQAADAARRTEVGPPAQEGRHIGPVVSAAQFARIQALIRSGIDEGARLVAGGPGRPDGIERGYFVRPTVFADVDNRMRIAREEIFGPVLSIIPFDGEDEAIRIANDSPYGLTHYLQTADPQRARRVARRLRAGMVEINGRSPAAPAPFGGYKQSGNGREGGVWGLEEFLELKVASGWPAG